MKTWLYCLAGLLFLISCSGINPDNSGDGSPADPEFTVSGVPDSPVKPYSSFTLSVSSKSSGYIDYKSGNKEVATLTLTGRRQYKVDVKAPQEETKVTVTFTQEADEDYPEVTKEVSFTVLPESTGTEATMPSTPHADLEGIKVSFTESTDLFPNPERGIFRSRNYYSNSEPINVSEVKAQRLSGHTLWYFGFYLTDFMDGDISQAFLNLFQANMDALREGGAKCILRFAYKDYHNDHELMDPEVAVVLHHVEQLKPLLQKNEDVIFVLQAGFVGAWGEWAYTSHFIQSPRKDTDFLPRRQLIDALLDALPASRQIQVRTPQFKMRMFGLSLKDTLTASTAHSGSALSRIAGHNDCFGASESDYGTFDNEKNDRDFWKADTRYTIMGGETCNVSDFCLCNITLGDLADYHWTHLNEDYHTGVINRWRAGNCYNQIVARLGYRLVMRDLFYSKDFAAGKPCTVTLRFYNTGFAAPMNPRDASLIWIDPEGKETAFTLDSDPRTWHPGWHVVTATFTPSSDKGSLCLALQDPLLPDRPEYSIALANEGVFDSSTGYNKLFEIK
ncbi:MAG: DUF4832 domain-containing protein [Bacteroidales bacterium]|nr:DUF4832 domain-containing protein [Bacteroidales bacterium]